MIFLKSFLTENEKRKIVAAIRQAEEKTSGEIRLYIESKCQEEPLQRAYQVFQELEMNQTAQRNGILIYIALEDRKLAIYGDEGIHRKVGDNFWKSELHQLQQFLSKRKNCEGICRCVEDVGRQLSTFFPFLEGDRNELEDDIVFGE